MNNHTIVQYFGKTPSRFFNSWMNRDGFDQLVLQNWSTFKGYGIPDNYLLVKLKFLKNTIKNWRVTAFHKETMELKNLKQKVHELDAATEPGT